MLTTIGPEQADEFARALVEARLVACVNVMPQARSVYRWNGAVEQEGEAVLLMETSAASARQLDETIAALAQLHPYDVPKIVALDARAVWPAYGAWVAEQVAR